MVVFLDHACRWSGTIRQILWTRLQRFSAPWNAWPAENWPIWVSWRQCKPRCRVAHVNLKLSFFYSCNSDRRSLELILSVGNWVDWSVPVSDVIYIFVLSLRKSGKSFVFCALLVIESRDAGTLDLVENKSTFIGTHQWVNIFLLWEWKFWSRIFCLIGYGIVFPGYCASPGSCSWRFSTAQVLSMKNSFCPNMCLLALQTLWRFYYVFCAESPVSCVVLQPPRVGANISPIAFSDTLQRGVRRSDMSFGIWSETLDKGR